MIARISLAVLLALLVGCEEEDEPLVPTTVLVAGWSDVDATVEHVAEGPHHFAASLPSHGVLVGTEGDLLRVDPTLSVPLLVSDDGLTPSAVAGLDDSTAVIAAPDGLFVLEGDSLRTSPLSDLLVDWEVTALLAVPHGDDLDLWLASPDGLKLHRDGLLHDVAVGDLQTAAATLAWGPTVDGVPSLWVAAGDDFYSITPQGNGFVALPVVDAPGRVDHLVSDAAGRLWAAGEGFHRRLGNETWQEMVTEAPVTGLWGRPDDSEVYIVTDHLIVAQGEGFYTVVGVPAGPIVGIDSLGRLLVLSEAGVDRVSASRPLGFLGLKPGAQLEDIAVLNVLPTAPLQVTGLSATLNGAAVELDEWLLLLDPLELEDGPQSLEFVVAYDDALEPVQTSFLFSVGEFIPPTWVGEIEPLFERECAECHTDSGVSRPLDTPAAWQADLDLIFFNLEEGRMPLPPRDPLTLSEIQLVRSWAAGNFPTE